MTLITRFLRDTTLQRQLSIAFAIGMLLLALFGSLLSSVQSSRQIRLLLKAQGTLAAESLAHGAHLGLMYRSADNAAAAIKLTLAFPDVTRVEIRDLQGKLLVGRDKAGLPVAANDPAPVVAMAPYLEDETDEAWSFVAPVTIEPNADSPFEVGAAESKPLGYVRVAQSKATLHQMRTEIFRANLTISFFFALLFLWLIRFLTGRMTGPLMRLAKIMTRARQGETEVLADESRGTRDIATMARAFNAMMTALWDREQRFRGLTALSSDWYWEQDAQGYFVYISDGLREITGLDPAKLLGQRRGDTPGVSYNPEQWTRSEALIAARKPFRELEWRIQHPDGTPRYGFSSGEPVWNRDGEFVGYRCVGRDNTRRKIAEQQVLQLNQDLERRVVERTVQAEEAMRQAQAANLAKSTFLASMSHEIRTPLNAVLGYAQLLERDPLLPPALLSSVTPIAKAGNHLLNLISDILDLSKIEAGQMSLRSAQFDLHGLIDEVALMFVMRCEQKGLAWCCENQVDAPCVVVGDAGKLRQVLINLLGNAVKFTERGKVTLRVAQQAQGVAFAVSDDGPGIAAADQQLVFEPFRQTDSGSKQGGTGLGLAISARQTELMGGSLKLESAEGQGARFSFVLPLHAAAAALAPHGVAPIDYSAPLMLAAARPLTLLVVDDNPENRDILTRMLSTLGAAVLQANDGQMALEQMRRQHVDLVFMDIRMPVMDGMQALKQMQLEFGAGAPRSVAITASVLAHETQHYMDEGFDDFIAKPFLFAQICQCLQRHLGVDLVARDAKPAPPPATAAGAMAMPARWHLDLAHALDSGWVSGVTALLEELQQACPDAQAFVQQVGTLLANFDLDAARSELEKVSQHE